MQHHTERGIAGAMPRSVWSPTSAPRGWSITVWVALAVYVALAAFAIALSIGPHLATPLAPMLGLLAAGVATLVLARTRVAAALAIAIALIPISLAFGTGAEIVIAPFLLFRYTVIAPPKLAWAGWGISTVGAVVGAVVFAFRASIGYPMMGTTPSAGTWQIDVMNILAPLGVLLLIVVLAGVNRGHRLRHIADLVHRADQQADIARASERERIAREMHDVIAHSLAVMIALSDGAQAAADKRPDESRKAVARIGETGRRTLSEVRRLLGTVRGDTELSVTSAPQPGLAQLAVLTDEFRSAGLPVRLELSGGADDDAILEFTIYRIVQESLTNVLRHGRDVQDVLVRVQLGAAQTTVLVEDVAAPATVSTDPGRGLVGIGERAALYDGEVEIGPRAGGGWRVFVRLHNSGE